MRHLKGWHHLVIEIELGCSLPGFSVHGISQARRLEWITISSSRGSSPPRDRTHISYASFFGRRILYQCHPGDPEIEYQFPKFGGLKIISVNNNKKKPRFFLVYLQLLIINICVCVLGSVSPVVSNSVQRYALQPERLFCP